MGKFMLFSIFKFQYQYQYQISKIAAFRWFMRCMDKGVVFKSVYENAINSINGCNLIQNCVKVHPNKILIKDYVKTINGPVFVCGFGKAVYHMAYSLEKILSSHIKQGIISVPFGTLALNKTKKLQIIKAYEGALNNIPDNSSLETTQKILTMLGSIPPYSLLIVLVSGGGSALLCSPKIPLSEYLKICKELASLGATIQELNCVRIALSTVKGGKLLLNHLTNPNIEVVSLIISDIIGDPIQYIASGPTIIRDINNNPIEYSPLNAYKILEKYNLTKCLTGDVHAILGPNDDDMEIKNINTQNIHNYIIGSNVTMLNAVYHYINKTMMNEFYALPPISDKICGEAFVFGKYLANLAIYLTLMQIQSEKNVSPHYTDDWLSEFQKSCANYLGKGCLENIIEQILQLRSQKSVQYIALLFGGETTVNLNQKPYLFVDTKDSNNDKLDDQNCDNEDEIYKNLQSMDFFTDVDNQIQVDVAKREAKHSDIIINKKPLGGRNQEIVLTFLIQYISMQKYFDNYKTNNCSTKIQHSALFSFGSDGQDGPTDAGGAFIAFDQLDDTHKNQSQICTKDIPKILNYAQFFLSKHDSYTFFNVFAGGKYHFKPGLSGTNVMDMQILLIPFII